MKVLFLHGGEGDSIVIDTQIPSSKITKLYYSFFKRICGKSNVIVFQKKINFLKLFFYPLLPAGISSIFLSKLIKKIKEENIEIVFLENSYYGMVCKAVKKKTNVKIISFFHNIESNIFKQLIHYYKEYGWKFLLLNKIKGIWLKFIEKSTIEFSNLLLLLNEKDKKILIQIYPWLDEKKIRILPLSLPDEESIFFSNSYNDGKTPIRILYVSSEWYPNVQGLKYFIQEVMLCLPQVELHVVGNIFKKRYEIPENNQVVYHGYIPDLKKIYHLSDFVIAPIFWGGGMKIKVVEALKYGKIIFGTTEAFQGYKFNPDIGEICNDTKSFVDKISFWIQNQKLRRFNPASRKLYETEYHPQLLEKKIKQYLEDLR